MATKIDTRYEGRRVYYDIVGDRETEVDAAIEGLMNSYHPMGYGTTVTKKTYNADGKPCACVRRSDSCD
jgi:hypothetical protein